MKRPSSLPPQESIDSLPSGVAGGGAASGDGDGSDAVQDLGDDREAFVRRFFRKGFDFAEELIIDNNDLRREVASLRAENSRLRTHFTSDDQLSALLRTVEELEGERDELARRSAELDAMRREYERRQAAIEREMNELANLYVASHHLHTTLDLGHVVQHIRDMIFQLVGAEAFAILVRDPVSKRPRAIAVSELTVAEIAGLEAGVGPISDAFLTGIPKIRQGPVHERATVEEPLALVPMLAGGKTIGVIVILGLLEQKEAWEDVDRALLDMLGTQAGTALIAANLFSGRHDVDDALTGLGDRAEVGDRP